MVSCVVITKGMLEQERRSGRVLMGYLLGLAVVGYCMWGFLRYAAETGEPINILETFCVVEQHYVNMLFLILGWVLVIADAPFQKGNLCLVLYRCGRRCWNGGMLCYILIQAFVYSAAMAAFTIIASSFSGYAGNMWSSPVYALAQDVENHIGVKYQITFPWPMMMRTMTVSQAFLVTFLFLYLYLVLLGVLFYTAALLLSGIAGIVTAMGVHLTGYLRLMDGHIESSLLARAVPGYFIDGTPGYWLSAIWLLAFTAAFMMLSVIMVQKVEFHWGMEADG